MKTDLVSIIIHYGEIEYLRQCLIYIFQNTFYQNLEIIVVSNEKILEMEELCIPSNKVKIINSHKNLGYAGSINLGIKFSSGTILAILNNDVIVGNNWLNPLIQILKKDNVAGV
ncbi:MAG TPA: glycosyltransferase [bacterium]|nr:glycosyltransferase [bacterium]